MIDSEDPFVKIEKGPATKLRHLLMALRWLFACETRGQIGPHFDIHSGSTTSKCLKTWTLKLQALLKPMVSC